VQYLTLPERNFPVVVRALLHRMICHSRNGINPDSLNG
jgi:hypothetical protein